MRKALNLNSADASILGELREAFYAETRESFFEALVTSRRAFGRRPRGSGGAKLDSAWAPRQIARTDRAQNVRRESPLDPTLGRETDIQRVVEAQFWLWLTLEGKGKGGQTLFERLALAAPEPKGSKAKGKGRAAKP